MIPNAYRVTVLVSAEHSDGKLKPQEVSDLVGMSFSGDRSLVWDHVPEVELVEVSAPGTWSRAPGAPVFAFDEERCADLVRASNASVATISERLERPHIELLDRFEGPDILDRAVTAALDNGAIVAALPNTGIGVYPMTCEDQQPVISVGFGDGAPNLLDQHDWIWPSEDDELSPVAFTVAVLAQVVERANQMVAENETRGAERPQLDHVYSGEALNLTTTDVVSTEECEETISGAFRVLCWLPDGGAVIGNGESPESAWSVPTAPERVA